MKASIALLALLTISCGSSGTAPTPTPVPTPAPTLATITGHVTATNGGQALGGLSATLAGHAATTDGAGTFAVQTTPASTAVLLLSGSGIVPRSLTLAATSSHDVALTAIAVGANFDLNFYREMIRNGFEAPGLLEPLRRWTRAPRIYLRSVDDAGRAINAGLIAMTAGTLQTATYPWTAGLGLAEFQQGADTKDGVDGWITVHWADHATPGQCGSTAVGGTRIDLSYLNGAACTCQSTGDILKQRTVAHELGHALGYWHTDSPADVMYGQANAACDITPSARERAHAAIAYARPVGNTDPDQDPTSAVTLATRTVR